MDYEDTGASEHGGTRGVAAGIAEHIGKTKGERPCKDASHADVTPGSGAHDDATDGDEASGWGRLPSCRQEAAEFKRLMGALLRFVKQRLGIASGPAEDRLARQDAASDVLDALWNNRELIGQFVRLNPERLGARELEIVDLWRHALEDGFVVTDAEGPVMALVTSDRRQEPRLILANLLERKGEELFCELPCLAELVLLPYCGRIVTDGRIKRVSSVVMPGGHELIRQQLRLAMKSPPITTADELIELSCRNSPLH